MLLGDAAIRKAIAEGDIVIDPFDERCLGSNSYDVHLAPTLLVHTDLPLDARKTPATTELEIHESGLQMQPGKLYLGATEEYTESRHAVPFLDGKSSGGRLGISIHVTAGRGDVGYCGHFTMELWVVEPVIVYAGMPIGQLIWFETTPVDVPYDKKASAKYNVRGRQARPMPLASKMWRNFR